LEREAMSAAAPRPSKVAVTPARGKAIGPYSLAIANGDLVFVSGQIALDPETGKLAAGDAASEARRALNNVAAILSAAQLGFGHVVKTTIFLTDMADFAAVNEVYKTYVGEPFPARSTIAVKALPLGAKVEIEMIAARSAA
jgi:2-iminobutanoate/2-iminopropanoate deaminase